MTAQVTNLDFSPEQEARLRRFCGLRPGDRELTPDDLIVTAEAMAVWTAEQRRLAGELADGTP